MKKFLLLFLLSFAGLFAQSIVVQQPYGSTSATPSSAATFTFAASGLPTITPATLFAANLVFASPGGATGSAGLRALVTADLPAVISAGTSVTSLSYFNASGTSSNSGNGLAQRFRSGYAITTQAPSAATRTYITGSDVGPFTAGQLQVGTMFHWHLDITKTGAGTATATFDIAFGTAGTTSDTARVSFTKPAGTANVDHCSVDIFATVRTNSASGVVTGDFTMLVDQTSSTLGGFLAAAKWVSSITNTSGTFDTTAPTHVGLCVTTGASDAWTINGVQAWTQNM